MSLKTCMSFFHYYCNFTYNGCDQTDSWAGLGAASGHSGEASPNSQSCSVIPSCSKGRKVQPKKAVGKAQTFPLEQSRSTVLLWPILLDGPEWQTGSVPQRSGCSPLEWLLPSLGHAGGWREHFQVTVFHTSTRLSW